jgi:hypothetical protein
LLNTLTHAVLHATLVAGKIALPDTKQITDTTDYWQGFPQTILAPTATAVTSRVLAYMYVHAPNPRYYGVVPLPLCAQLM